MYRPKLNSRDGAGEGYAPGGAAWWYPHYWGNPYINYVYMPREPGSGSLRGIPEKRQYQPSAVIMGVNEDAAARRAALMSAIMDLAVPYGYGAVDPLLILAQSAFETGWFKSPKIVQHNNAFGMRQPQQRPTKSLGAVDGFATFATLADSVEDYFMRQRYFHEPNTADPVAYINATVAQPYSYNAAPDYASKWASIYASMLGATDSAGDGVYTGPTYPEPSDGGSSLGLFALIGLAFMASKSR